MSYYPTIEEDLKRAKEILAKGQPTADELEGVNVPSVISLAGGTIYGADIFAAYKLLESFVAELECERAEPPVLTLNRSQVFALRSILLEVLLCKSGQMTGRHAHSEVFVDVVGDREVTTEELLRLLVETRI